MTSILLLYMFKPHVHNTRTQTSEDVPFAAAADAVQLASLLLADLCARLQRLVGGGDTTSSSTTTVTAAHACVAATTARAIVRLAARDASVAVPPSAITALLSDVVRPLLELLRTDASSPSSSSSSSTHAQTIVHACLGVALRLGAGATSSSPIHAAQLDALATLVFGRADVNNAPSSLAASSSVSAFESLCELELTTATATSRASTDAAGRLRVAFDLVAFARSPLPPPRDVARFASIGVVLAAALARLASIVASTAAPASAKSSSTSVDEAAMSLDWTLALLADCVLSIRSLCKSNAGLLRFRLRFLCVIVVSKATKSFRRFSISSMAILQVQQQISFIFHPFSYGQQQKTKMQSCCTSRWCGYSLRAHRRSPIAPRRHRPFCSPGIMCACDCVRSIDGRSIGVQCRSHLLCANVAADCRAIEDDIAIEVRSSVVINAQE
jgi:hypothetical protein